MSNEIENLKKYIASNNITIEPQNSGLYYIETEKGTGDYPDTDDEVSVHYTGKLLDGTVFDSSHRRGEPFQFTLGIGEVIRGWDEGVAMMKEGGKATLIIPSKLGYGSRGVGGIIPANSTLIFDVELLKIN